MPLRSQAGAALHPLSDGDPMPPEDRVVDISSSLARLYSERRPRLLGYFARRACVDEAQDLVQDAFVRLASLDAGRAASIDRPAAYLHRIAANLLRDRAKFAERRATSLHIPADEAPLLAQDQHETLEARDMLRRLEAAMLRLKPKTREIFMAHRLDGFSYAEIAVHTGLSVKGVEKQMSRAIAQIDRLLSVR